MLQLLCLRGMAPFPIRYSMSRWLSALCSLLGTSGELLPSASCLCDLGPFLWSWQCCQNAAPGLGLQRGFGLGQGFFSVLRFPLQTFSPGSTSLQESFITAGKC